MRTVSRVVLLLAVLSLAAGPLATVPVAASAGLRTAASPQASGAGHGALVFLLYGLGALGAIRVGDLGKLAKKFVRNAVNAANDYKDGVAGAGADWEQNTAASEANYNAGTQAAIARGAFAKGVRGAGAAKFVEKATKNGAVRYGPGVTNAEADWQKGFAPVAQVLQSIQLPAPGPRRSPQNQERANKVALELGKWKESQ